MLLVVGRIGRAHGIKGEVSVQVRTDEPEARMAPGMVLVTDPEAAGPLTVTSGRVHGGRLLLVFEGVADRSAAEALRGTMLLAEVDPAAVPEDADEWYDHQLVGLEVVLENGTRVGEVREVLHLPGHDLLAVERAGGDQVLLPFVAEIVPVVDVPGRRVVVAPPPGLIDDATGG